MNNPKIKLFKSLSEEFVKNFSDAEPAKYGLGVAPYGSGNNRNTCAASLKSQAKQLRKLLLDITEGL